MPAFESSDLAVGKRLIWQSAIKNMAHCHIDIFGDYWERFNTMRVPILGEDRFLEIALELEHVAKDQEDLEKLLEERKEQWEQEAKRWLDGIALKSSRDSKSFQCKDASNAAFRASATGSLQHFLELLNGVAHGWEPDEVQDEKPNGNDTDVVNPDSNPQNTSAETDDESEEIRLSNKFGYVYYIQKKLASKNPVYKRTYDDDVHKAPFFKSDQALLIRQRFEKLKRKRSHEDEKTPPSGPSRATNADNQDGPSRPKKRLRVEDEHSEDTTDDISQNVSSKGIDRVADKSSARKRHRPNDDDEEVDDGERKRQRRASPELPASISQDADESNVRKTPRRSPTKSQRQKRPTTQTPASSEPSASLSKATDAVTNPPEIFTAPTPQINPPTPKKVTKQRQSVAKKDSISSKKTNRVQKHTKKSSTSRNLNSSPVSSNSRDTRTSRRNNSSSLWELDSSGKPSQQ